MPRSAPIPRALLRKAFTVAEAEAAGVSYHRLRGPSSERVGHGRYRCIESQLVYAAAEKSDTADQELYRWSSVVPPPSAVMLLEVLSRCPDAVVSHATAARLRNIWLPSRLVADDRLHVTRAKSCGVLRDRWVVTHRSDLPRHHSTPLVLIGHSIRVTVLERLWTELAVQLTEEELLVLGVHLIRRSGRSRATTDMGWRRTGLVLQYEGTHHSHRIDEDVRRDAVFQRKGYAVIRVSASDAKDGFRGVITRVRAHLEAEGQLD